MNDWTTIPHIILAVGAATLLGGLIGLERELRGHWAGLRTHIMVSVGAAMFVLSGMIVSRDSEADLTRVIQGIAAGVGFIGAGTIIKLTDRVEVKGLTTASSIWLAAAVGTACGIKAYALAVTGTIVCLAVLYLLRKVEDAIDSSSRDKKDDASTGEDKKGESMQD